MYKLGLLGKNISYSFSRNYFKNKFEIENINLLERLFEITQMDVEASSIKLLHHTEAREKKKITEYMGLKSGMKGGKNIGEHSKFPWIKISVNHFDCLVEGYDFRISTICNTAVPSPYGFLAFAM